MKSKRYHSQHMSYLQQQSYLQPSLGRSQVKMFKFDPSVRSASDYNSNKKTPSSIYCSKKYYESINKQLTFEKSLKKIKYRHKTQIQSNFNIKSSLISINDFLRLGSSLQSRRNHTNIQTLPQLQLESKQSIFTNTNINDNNNNNEQSNHVNQQSIGNNQQLTNVINSHFNKKQSLSQSRLKQPNPLNLSTQLSHRSMLPKNISQSQQISIKKTIKQLYLPKILSKYKQFHSPRNASYSQKNYNILQNQQTQKQKKQKQQVQNSFPTFFAYMKQKVNKEQIKRMEIQRKLLKQIMLKQKTYLIKKEKQGNYKILILNNSESISHVQSNEIYQQFIQIKKNKLFLS